MSIIIVFSNSGFILSQKKKKKRKGKKKKKKRNHAEVASQQSTMRRLRPCFLSLINQSLRLSIPRFRLRACTSPTPACVLPLGVTKCIWSRMKSIMPREPPSYGSHNGVGARAVTRPSVRQPFSPFCCPCTSGTKALNVKKRKRKKERQRKNKGKEKKGMVT